MSNAKNTNNVPISIPSGYRETLEDEVVVARGLNNAVYVYTKENFEKVQEKIDKNKKKYDLTYPKFDEFISAGFVSTTINDKNELLLPDFLYAYMGPEESPLEFQQKELWLEIRKEHDNRCLCPEPMCAKCLGVNCQDDNCNVHTLEEKAKRRKKFKGN